MRTAVKTSDGLLQVSLQRLDGLNVPQCQTTKCFVRIFACGKLLYVQRCTYQKIPAHALHILHFLGHTVLYRDGLQIEW